MAEDIDKIEPAGETNLPERLKGDLKALFAASVEVPVEVDRKMLAKAQRRMRRPRRIVALRRFAAGAAAAAAIVIVVWLAGLFTNRADIDGSGRVDILDAFVLAKRIEAPEELTAELDINRDGVVDQKDVDEVAMRAVRL